MAETDITIRDGDGSVRGEITVDYPSNSYRQRDVKKAEPVKKVAHGKAVVRRKTFRERLSNWLFVNADDYEDFVYEDIIRPAVIDAVSDISHNVVDTIRDTIDVALFGSARGARHRRGGGYYRTSYDVYDEYWDRERRSRRREREADREDRYTRRRSDDVAVKVESKAEAVDLVRSMQKRVHDYKVASVLNLYDMADMPTKPADDDYGWNLGHPFEARITGTPRDGYIVEPNQPIWLDR